MKAAIVYSGLPRFISEQYKNHINFLFKEQKPDVYFSFWDIWGYNPVGWSSNVDHTNSKTLTEQDKKSIVDTLNPKEYEFVQFEQTYNSLTWLLDHIQKKVETKKYDWAGNPKSYVFQFYALSRVMNLLKENYDVVVRLRSDIEFVNANINYNLDEDVHIYSGYCYPDMNDQFAYGSQKSMKIYGNVFTYLESIDLIHPESILYYHLQHNNIAVKKDIDCHYIIRRE